MRRALVVALLVTAACGHPEPPDVISPAPSPRPSPAAPPRETPRPPAPSQGPVGAPFQGGPQIKIGLLVDVATATIGGGNALAVRPGDGGRGIVIPAGRAATLTRSGSALRLEIDHMTIGIGSGATVEGSDPGAVVRVAGKDYRGVLELRTSSGGILVVNWLSVESYLGGVVAAELGIPDNSAEEALEAQAIIARTYAVKQMGRHQRAGFDLLPTVADQRYDGVSGETGAAWLALAETKGVVASYQGAPIDAFFHSTCGGRTASGREVFAFADRPYLRSVSDLDPNGQAYCRRSPRFQWQQAWEDDALATALRSGLRVSAEEAGFVRSVEVSDRSPSGRATQLRVRLRGRDVVIDGSNAVRRALPPPDLDMLRSATFTLTFRTEGARVVRLEASGQGNGHGVGLCQWGAIGRAQAGQGHAEILAAYFPGTSLERRW